MGWENQCEHLGDIRLSTKKGMMNLDKNVLHHFCFNFSIRNFTRTIGFKCKQEFYGFSLLLQQTLFSKQYFFIAITLGFASGLGFGQTFFVLAIFEIYNIAAFGLFGAQFRHGL